jgi:hypothetical protein
LHWIKAIAATVHTRADIEDALFTLVSSSRVAECHPQRARSVGLDMALAKDRRFQLAPTEIRKPHSLQFSLLSPGSIAPPSVLSSLKLTAPPPICWIRHLM